MRKIVTLVMTIIMVITIFAHNPFSGYISSDEIEVGGSYETTSIDPIECYKLVESSYVQGALSRNAAEKVSLIMLERKLTDAEIKRLDALEIEQNMLSKQINELKAREYVLKLECMYVKKYMQTERELLDWESKSPIIQDLKTFGSLIYVMAFFAAIFVIFMFSTKRD